jgi:hypothetical protein
MIGVELGSSLLDDISLLLVFSLILYTLFYSSSAVLYKFTTYLWEVLVIQYPFPFNFLYSDSIIYVLTKYSRYFSWDVIVYINRREKCNSNFKKGA